MKCFIKILLLQILRVECLAVAFQCSATDVDKMSIRQTDETFLTFEYFCASKTSLVRKARDFQE